METALHNGTGIVCLHCSAVSGLMKLVDCAEQSARVLHPYRSAACKSRSTAGNRCYPLQGSRTTGTPAVDTFDKFNKLFQSIEGFLLDRTKRHKPVVVEGSSGSVVLTCMLT